MGVGVLVVAALAMFLIVQAERRAVNAEQETIRLKKELKEARGD